MHSENLEWHFLDMMFLRLNAQAAVVLQLRDKQDAKSLEWFVHRKIRFGTELAR